MKKPNLKIVDENTMYKENISNHERNTRFTSIKKMRDFYNSEAFEKEQSKLDKAYLEAKQQERNYKHQVWLLWVTFDEKYEKAGIGRKLEGVYVDEKAIDRRIAKIENYVYVKRVEKIVVDVKV